MLSKLDSQIAKVGGQLPSKPACNPVNESAYDGSRSGGEVLRSDHQEQEHTAGNHREKANQCQRVHIIILDSSHAQEDHRNGRHDQFAERREDKTADGRRRRFGGAVAPPPTHLKAGYQVESTRRAHRQSI